MSETLLTMVAPQLPSSDLELSKNFMTEKLGFECLADYGEMVILRRDSTELHFWKCSDPKFAKTLAKESSCYFRVSNIQPLFEAFKTAGVDFGYELEEKPWGMNEMQVNDPDGNAIRFGEPLT